MDAPCRSGASTPATIAHRCRRGASTPSVTQSANLRLGIGVITRVYQDPLYGTRVRFNQSAYAEIVEGPNDPRTREKIDDHSARMASTTLSALAASASVPASVLSNLGDQIHKGFRPPAVRDSARSSGLGKWPLLPSAPAPLIPIANGLDQMILYCSCAYKFER
jgi:hypothetical protein